MRTFKKLMLLAVMLVCVVALSCSAEAAQKKQPKQQEAPIAWLIGYYFPDESGNFLFQGEYPTQEECMQDLIADQNAIRDYDNEPGKKIQMICKPAYMGD